jgi:PAS domain S-box-containing protein
MSRPADDTAGDRPDDWLCRWSGRKDALEIRDQLRRLLEEGPQPFAVIDMDRRIIHANLAFRKLVGYPLEELLGMSVMDLTATGFLAVTRKSHTDVLEKGKTERVTKEYRRKDGSLVPVELIIDVLRDGAGEPLGLYAFVTDISERIRAEQALRTSERQYRQLYDEAPVGYYELDREGRILNINRTACDLLEYSREELIGRPIVELISPEEREPVMRMFAEQLADRLPLVPHEQVLRTKSGRRLTVEIQEKEHRGDEGAVETLRIVVQDISRRKETERALIESERRARALFDGIHDAVFVHDQKGRILDANSAACRQLGYSREELLGMNTSQIDVAEFAAGFEERLERQLNEGQLCCEGLHRTKSGRIIPVEVTTSTIHYDNGVAVLAILRDITERKALERTRRDFAAAQMRNAHEMELKNRALSESEARYRQLAEGSLDAIVVADGEGRITLFNPAAEKIFGYSSGELTGRPLELLIPGVFQGAEGPPATDAPSPPPELAEPAATPRPSDSPEEPRAAARPTPRTGERRRTGAQLVGKTVELNGRKKDGTEFPLELSLSEVDVNGRIQYIGSIRDQTERQRMRAMLAHTDKLASIGLLSAGVAHEINNPLAYVQNNLVVLQRDVRGLLELLRLYEGSRQALAEVSPQSVQPIEALKEEIDWEYVRGNLDQIIERTRTGVKRVANIVGKMRGLARTTPPQWETVAIHDLIESALEMMRGRLKHQRAEVLVEIRDVSRIECVPDQIGQVLLNLLINALQAIEGSGRQDGGRIEVEASRKGPWVSIEIRDNGPGIEQQYLGRLFDPFFTTKPVGEGTGLGLAISHGIITGHGGRIEVESEPGVGTTFRVLLPEHRRPEQAPTLVPRTNPAGTA